VPLPFLQDIQEITNEKSFIMNLEGNANFLVQKLRRSSVGSASACCNLGSALEAPLAERRRDEDSRRRASANGEG
jgi:hypothetical protein